MKKLLVALLLLGSMAHAGPREDFVRSEGERLLTEHGIICRTTPITQAELDGVTFIGCVLDGVGCVGTEALLHVAMVYETLDEYYQSLILGRFAGLDEEMTGLRAENEPVDCLGGPIPREVGDDILGVSVRDSFGKTIGVPFSIFREDTTVLVPFPDDTNWLLVTFNGPNVVKDIVGLKYLTSDCTGQAYFGTAAPPLPPPNFYTVGGVNALGRLHHPDLTQTPTMVGPILSEIGLGGCQAGIGNTVFAVPTVTLGVWPFLPPYRFGIDD